ncbi:MAG: MupA/Atu3671 family FMN-dependent luciferase-like monooxygenase [Desertimonas sp.]
MKNEGDNNAVIRCAVVGDEPLVVQCIEIAEGAGLTLGLVATDNEAVRSWVEARGGVVVGHGEALAVALDEHPCDVLFSIANLRMLPAAVLDRVGTAINFHDGPLPDYAGLNVTTWALLRGATEHGITWHLMDAGVDTGQIVVSTRFPIAADETAFSLNARCYEAALATFGEVARRVRAGELDATAQPAGDRHEFRRHDRPAVLVDPVGPADELVRAVRALDVGHRLWNGVGAVRWVIGDDVFVIERAHVAAVASSRPAGTGVAVADADAPGGPALTIAMGDGDVTVTEIATTSGGPVSPADVADAIAACAGGIAPSPDADLVESLRELEPALAPRERPQLDALASAEPSTPTMLGRANGPVVSASTELPHTDDAAVVAAVATWLARTGDAGRAVLAVSTPTVRADAARLGPLTTAPAVALQIRDRASFTAVRDEAGAALDRLRPLLRDAIGRDPRTRGHELTLPVHLALGTSAPDEAGSLRLAWDGTTLRAAACTDSADPTALDRAVGQIASLVASAATDPERRPEDLDLLTEDDRALLAEVNDTATPFDRSATIDRLFQAQVERDPTRRALSFGDRTLTYGDVAAMTDALARRFVSAGIGRGDRVGIAVPRGIDMVIGVLATLRVGAAYLPLDPTYPVERLELMVEDAGIAALLAHEPVASQLARPGIAIIDPAADAATAATGTLPAGPEPTDLAYVIYTSGSTGRPKGVMLEHRQVVNFFVAMDEVIVPHDGGVWLAVTSLSFDISVLELLWTLTRGYHVVLKADRGIPVEGTATRAVPTRDVTFSLFYFAAGEDAAKDGYRLLLDSARFADTHGFEAVWTPERHFHAFGGAYPNPSVAGAALAAVTDRVKIRAGSVVQPLHSPIRIAEEWSVVDNLSRGRVGISFAAGWQPNDFVLNPSAYATAKSGLADGIAQVRALWRGESIELPGHDGAPVSVSTLPRPVQPELPVWLTSAGTPATFERAGTLGYNVLTHLLGQSIPQLTENLARYRAAWTAAGHPGEGRVTLMLHTYLDRDAETAREVAREPMKGYLSTAVGLLKDVASAFPTFAGRTGADADDMFKSLTADEMDQLLEVAAQRYLRTSGLFGTPADVADVVDEVSAAGVDEIACLVDFGIETDLVLDSLDLLDEAKRMVEARRHEAVEADGGTAGPGNADPVDDSVAALAARHGVTHLQCTPSLAAMLAADPGDRAALGTIGHLMLGGEALPTELARELRGLLPGRFTNMYGPTETTIWSLIHEIEAVGDSSVPIGRPIANTTIHVLDTGGGAVPTGAFGELHIGGDGVARGYHDRPELTAERFVERDGIGRVYATGDVVRLHPAGYVEFAGRSDNQVKIRGHRIELGEIETVIDQHPSVVQSVVVAREDRGDTRLVAFVITHRDGITDGDDVRKHVAAALPDAMVPSAIVSLDAFPLTPNGKIDRKALGAVPIDSSAIEVDRATSAPPADDLERAVAEIWSAELDRPVGRDDNFFDIGGHSLLAVTVFRKLVDATGADLALTDVFRFPTIRTFAAHLGGLQNGDGTPTDAASQAPSGADRGALRRRALGRRGSGSGA